MNENIDLTKILEGCPKGTMLYSPLLGDVFFNRISKNGTIIVEAITLDGYRYNEEFASDGLYNTEFVNPECLLFPSKKQRDWSKFERFWDKSNKNEKFDPKTLQPFDKVLVRDFVSDNWMSDFFERIEEMNAFCITTHWEQCIPYNEETKHLLGTKDDCQDFYKWWEE